MDGQQLGALNQHIDLVSKSINGETLNLTSGTTTSITGTADTQVIAAPSNGAKLYITQILVTNGHASTGTYVNIKDGSTTIYTGYAAASGGGFTLTFPKPIRLTANTALKAANETNGSDTRVSASGFIL